MERPYEGMRNESRFRPSGPLTGKTALMLRLMGGIHVFASIFGCMNRLSGLLFHREALCFLFHREGFRTSPALFCPIVSRYGIRKKFLSHRSALRCFSSQKLYFRIQQGNDLLLSSPYHLPALLFAGRPNIVSQAPQNQRLVVTAGR
jgi:hypothetical protein